MVSTYTDADDSYKEQDQRKRMYYWNTAIGLNRVDGLTPSKYLLSLKDDSVAGQKSYQVIECELHKYYQTQDITNPEIQDKRECDIVSTRIAKILDSCDFVLSPIMLLNIHKRIFEGLFSGKLAGYGGRFRDYNISKAEQILDGRSIVYGDYTSIENYLKYDFENEAKKRYVSMNLETTTRSLSSFISSIWQVHPFAEGNTRATAVFLKKYMRTLGFDNTDNTMFQDHAVYFRNALVVSNFTDVKRKLKPDFHYIETFILNLIDDRKHELPEIFPRK